MRLVSAQQKINKMFLKFRKTTRRAKYNTKIIIDDTEDTDQTCILNHIKDFYEALFKKREQKTTAEIKAFLNVIDVPKLSEDQVKLCEEDLTEKDLYKSLRSMQNDKSPGNDGLTKEFYETFWNDLIEIFVNSVREAKVIGHLRRASVDSKIISKALSEKLTEVLPDLISSQQMAYVKNRHIGESGKLISDIIEMTKIRKIGFLVTMDIEKAFDSLDHNFLISTLEKYGFG